jgi:hypothetical protein
MTKCDDCGSTIVFGGAREAGRCFCHDRCRQRGVLLGIAEQDYLTGAIGLIALTIICGPIW